MRRPYCSEELLYLETEMHKQYRLGDVFAVHLPCSHRYRVKKGGRKEQEILKAENNVLDEHTCSVCFKLRCNDDNPSMDDIEYIKEKDGEIPSTLKLLEIKNSFYKWLYQRMN
jgi:hypothetical protein